MGLYEVVILAIGIPAAIGAVWAAWGMSRAKCHVVGLSRRKSPEEGTQDGK